MMMDVLRTNRGAVREALEAMQAELDELDTLLEMENESGLEERLWQAKSGRPERLLRRSKPPFSPL